MRLSKNRKNPFLFFIYHREGTDQTALQFMVV